jgi:hypothetical protein
MKLRKGQKRRISDNVQCVSLGIMTHEIALQRINLLVMIKKIFNN